MDLTTLLQQDAAHAWLYLPVAIALGALHGLEPGHSKTMMAAFIIAVRGTRLQAALLGLSAALSHSLVIWALAALALRFGERWNVEATEPYFLIATGLIVIAMACWTIRRSRAGHDHHHHHHHDDGSRTLAHRDGEVVLSIHEDGVPPRFRIARHPAVTPVNVRTVRADGAAQVFALREAGPFWESEEKIPEPHAFRAEVRLRGPSGEQVAAAEFAEHDRAQGGDEEHEDAHAREHAEQIRRRFAGREVTTGQIVLFGLTGGLMPCPAALTVLLLCLQLKRFTLGFTLVAGFSLGLALTLVSVGVAAAWGMQQVAKRSGFWSRLAHKAPLLSSCLLIVLGAVFVARGAWLLA